ncbi:DUF2267 domain-containing protein [Halorarum salinum]|uniref:DUF2267 domain-containing protein n=1 Tax=Halorarum salinum TaxID=2743089 RepID=UPI001C527476|nr:DUF2267 domain-containing protein [Halobaculum salinum]
MELAEGGRAVRAARATLSTLGERTTEGAADDLASPLPMEVDRFLGEAGQRFGFDEIADRVAEREEVERSDAVYHAKVVLALVGR